MKKLLVATGAVFVVALAIYPTLPGRALSSDIITEAQIKAIKTHCVTMQASLNQLNRSDALLRYNRGKLYRTIADKLMSPLNQRLASNQLDGSELVKTTASFDDAYEIFYDAYKSYETSLSDVLRTDCTKLPTTFYDKLSDARAKRLALNGASQRIVALAEAYMAEFNNFRKEFNKESNDG